MLSDEYLRRVRGFTRTAAAFFLSVFKQVGRLIEYRDDADDRPVSPCADDHFSDLGRDAEHADRDFNIENVEAVDNDFNVPYSQPAEDELGYDNLISAPGVVAEKLVIAYTKAAKKFNVRQMKESYWKVGTETVHNDVNLCSLVVDVEVPNIKLF